MVHILAVTPERHATKKWERVSDYRFAATEAIVPIVGAELGRAASSMPLAFTEQTGRYTLVALLSPAPGRNLFVNADGRWIGKYVPACLRVYPFRLLAKGEKALLAVDEDSGLVIDGGSVGEDFFTADLTLSPALQSVVELLRQVQHNRNATDRAVSALAEAAVIKPWEIKVKSRQGDQVISGLHHVDESSLAALSDSAFLTLREASALSIAYAQILSEAQLGTFTELAKTRRPPGTAAALPENLDALFGLQDEEIIKFK